MPFLRFNVNDLELWACSFKLSKTVRIVTIR